MAYKIEFKPSAARELRKLPKEVQERLGVKINNLTHNPRPQGVEALKGEKGLLRIRAGDYRIIYQVKDKILTILVLRIGHRREVYR